MSEQRGANERSRSLRSKLSAPLIAATTTRSSKCAWRAAPSAALMVPETRLGPSRKTWDLPKGRRCVTESEEMARRPIQAEEICLRSSHELQVPLRRTLARGRCDAHGRFGRHHSASWARRRGHQGSTTRLLDAIERWADVEGDALRPASPSGSLREATAGTQPRGGRARPSPRSLIARQSSPLVG